MSRFNYGANTATEEAHPVRLLHLLILWAFMLALFTLWSTFIMPASAGSKGDPQSKGAPPAAPNCDPDWQVVSSPNVTPTYRTYLRATDGEAPADMWAVGYVETGGINRAVIQHWDGTSWSLASFGTAGTESSALYSVASLAVNDVWAVGNYKNIGSPEKTLIMHWDGTYWTMTSSPNVGTGANFLKSVHSLYANNVWAVGYYASGSTFWTLTIRWNGASWATVSSPNIGIMSKLEAVAVASNTHIWAVGRYISGGLSYALTMRYNGTSWNTVSYTAYTGLFLYGISALSPTNIYAVGYSDNCTFAFTCSVVIHWDGTKWLLAATTPEIDPGYTNGLYSIRATSATSVWAVGYYNLNGIFYTLIVKWDGTTWHHVTNSNATGNNVFYGIGASGLSHVWAVGDHAASDGLIEKWNGTQWNLVNSPAVSLTTSTLVAADALSSSDAWAVGYSRTNGTNTVLVERWNGSAWNVVSAPAPSGSSYLTSVTAISANNVWAVGYYDNGSNNRTLIMHWDGTAWTKISSPNFGTNTNVLNGVYGSDANNVWAVGYALNPPVIPQQTLVLRWNGRTWSLVTSPNGTPYGSSLNSVSGTSASDVWAVGTSYDGASLKTLTLHWDGSTWSVIPSVNTGGSATNNHLASITALAATDVWAVGSYSTPDGFNTLILHWNGSAWAIAASPNVSLTINSLYAVDKVSATGIWAVGVYRNGNIQRTLAEHWDGTAWTVVTTPNVGAQSSYLIGVAVASPTDIYAVGGNNGPVNSQTLVERYNPCP